jgi:hypothetical protein
LQEQLPLRVLVTTPTDILTYNNASSAVTLTGRQALTVSHMGSSQQTCILTCMHLHMTHTAAVAGSCCRSGIWLL